MVRASFESFRLVREYDGRLLIDVRAAGCREVLLVRVVHAPECAASPLAVSPRGRIAMPPSK
eukprot:5523809-Prorocentrum_lima.AAC.1